MKITRKQLRNLIEGLIGYPDKPPVSPEKYMRGDEINPKISRAIQSTDDPAYRRQFINLGATLGDEVLGVLDNMGSEMDSFIDDDNEPLNKDVARLQSIAYQMDASPWRGNQVDSYFTTSMSGEEFKVVIDGDVLTDIYEAIADGNNSGAEKIAYDYLNTIFLNSNPEVANWYNSNVASNQGFQNYPSFANFYFNQKIDDIHFYGILPYEFDISMWNRYAIGKNLSLYDLRKGAGGKRLEIKVGNDMREDVYRLAKSLGLLSQGFGSHPLAYFFYDQKLGSIDIG